MEGRHPYISEESLRTQRVGVYLNDLKQRIKGLCQQHDTLIRSSTDLFNEVNDVSAQLCAPNLTEDNKCEQLNRIKILINKFEEMHMLRRTRIISTPEEDHKVDVQKLLRDFEKLNESRVLNESLQHFKRAKESFEKIEHSLVETEVKDGLEGSTPSTQKITQTIVVANSLREKINMFERKSFGFDEIDESGDAESKYCTKLDASTLSNVVKEL